MSLYEIKPIKAGILTYTGSTPTFSIDLISRDEIVYFESDRYPEVMITKKLKNKLEKENFSGITFLDFNKIFSLEHEIEHPGKELPQWVRMTILRENENKATDFYLTDDNKMIINDKVKSFLEENSRLKRCSFEKIDKDKVITNQTDNSEKPIFKQEKEKPLIGILVVAIIVAIIGYVIF